MVGGDDGDGCVVVTAVVALDDEDAGWYYDVGGGGEGPMEKDDGESTPLVAYDSIASGDCH